MDIANYTIDDAVLLIIVLILLFSVIILWLVFLFIRNRGALTRSLNMVLYQVTVPQEVLKSPEGQKDEKQIISIMEQFYTSLSKMREGFFTNLLYGKPYVAIEMAVEAESAEISFYIVAPRRTSRFIEKQINGFFPHANINLVKDYSIFTPGAKTAGGYLKIEKNPNIPFRTYLMMESDPIKNITNAFSKLPFGEGAAIQIIIKPAMNAFRQTSRQIIKELQKGHPIDRAIAATYVSKQIAKAIGEMIMRDFLNQKPKTKEEDQSPVTPEQENLIKVIENKASKVVFETDIRLIASAATQDKAELVLDELEGAFNQFNAPNFNGFKVARSALRGPSFIRNLVFNFVFRIFSKRNSILLSTEELASVFHFPIVTTETPNIKWLKAKGSAAPANIPAEGLILGRNSYRGEDKIIRITQEDRRRHLYAIGQTGTGKSVFFSNLIKQDIQSGHGVCVIDPHGDLVEDVMAIIPKNRIEDVVIFDPSDMERPVGLNMLEVKNPEQKDFAIQEMIAIFYKLFPPEMIGPMFEHNMRNVMLTLMEDKEYPGTIAEIPRMFTDPAFQKYKLAKVRDPIVRAFWEKEMAKTSDFHKSEMLGYLISKVGRFVENEMMRNIIGQPKSGFDFREIMDKGKILLVNLSKGKTGEVNSSLLGLIIVSKLQMAAMSRTDIPQTERRDFYLYIDEFHNFTTDSVATILAEARKYRLNLNITHQFIAQLPDNIRDAVFGNVGTMVVFRIGAEDAETVAKQFKPTFEEQDLINIDNANAYVKLLINGMTSKPFDIKTYPPISGNRELAEAIRNLSRLKYGRPKYIVGHEIMERSQLGNVVRTPTNPIPGERSA